MEKHFTHLHLHTDYSLLDGAISLDKLIEYGLKNNRKALAISDHGNIFAAVKFFEKCKKAKIKPILGIEAYLTEDVNIKDINNRYYHLLLLVENKVGYKNICKLISESYTKGFYFKPRIDYELLSKYSEGLIATSTCIGGHIPQLLLNDKDEEAKKILNNMTNLFKDRYYLEVQPSYLNEQKIINQKIFELEKKMGIPIIATGDCHYPTKEDQYAHEVMLAVQTRTTMTDKNRMTFGECRAHMQNISEFQDFFPNRDDIIWRTGEIADKCNFEFETGKLFFPKFEIPKNFSSDKEFFKIKSIEGFEKLKKRNKIPLDKLEIYENRLNEEIEMINQMGFPTYFLIVSDFICWAKKNNIAVGPGRGSVVGSLVSWALEITDLDPIKYNLLFERFLNPERISMPDVDIDFCINGREKVIQYVKDKYGHDKVGQIITFGSMMAKGVLKDVARALGFSFEDANSITELIPDELKITLKDSLEQEPKLQELCNKNPKVAELFDVATRLEGLIRHASKHAAGIVISPEPIAEVLPIHIPSKSTDIVTQYAMTELELLGFLKMDFLGLKNLTLITNILNLIKENYSIDIDISEIELNDCKTYELFQRGDTSGVFQFESSGLKDVLRKAKPSLFEDIIALNALYRPGPLGSGMIDDFIDGRHEKKEIKYFFNELEPILKDTYGVIVYQEQVMKIASVIAGYSLGESDILRRAMGKKKADEMAKQKNKFVSNAKERGFDKNKSDELFELMAYFAGYGFNKSHSAAYALIAYQTAYLKANYTKEFLAALVSLEISNPENMIIYLNEIRSNKINLLGPDINFSSNVFKTENNNIRFGLSGIKNVGEIACQCILKEREKNGNFIDFSNFCLRIDLRICNKRVLESLIISGAFDSINDSRAEMIANLDSSIEFSDIKKDRKNSGQLGLFDNLGENKEDSTMAWIKVHSWSLMQSLEKEKEILGIYISKHPLDEYDDLLLKIGIHSILDLNKDQNYIITRGSLVSVKEILTKTGEKMAFGVLEDQNTKIEVIFFPKIYKKYEIEIKQNSLILITGNLSKESSLLKIKVESVIILDKFNIENYVNKWKFFITEENYILFSNLLRDNLLKESNDINSKNLIIYFEENQKIYEHHSDKKFIINKDIILNNTFSKINISFELRK